MIPGVTGLAPVSAGEYPEKVLGLLEYMAGAGNPSVENYCASLNISPKNLDEDFIAWCGRSSEEFLYFASPFYSRQQVRGNPDLFFDTEVPAQHLVGAVVFSPLVESSGPLLITYNFVETSLGRVMLGETERGVVYLSFGNERENLNELRGMFTDAIFEQATCKSELRVKEMIAHPFSMDEPLSVCTKCTPFQERVWTKLLETRPGTFTTYGDIAVSLGDKNASRAVGSALGSNPVAWLIPCHRVVNADGSYGHFRWGSARKKMFLAWEAARLHHK